MSDPGQPPPTGPGVTGPTSAAATTGGTQVVLDDAKVLHTKIVGAIKTCFDPEIPVNIYELGLVYDIQVAPEGDVAIKMTLTSPMCPVAGSLPPEVEAKVRTVPGVRSAKVDVVWDPPWDPSRMSEAAKLELGMF